MQMFKRDVVYALRQMVKNPGFTLITALTLALGIGANTAIFSVLNGVLIRPLPYGNGDRIVHIGYREPAPGIENVRFAVPEIFDYRQQSQHLEDVVEYHSLPFTLLGEGDPDRVQVGVVSANFFDVFGIEPLLGRTLRATDDRPGADPVLVMSHEYWQHRFAGDSSIVGKRLRMNDQPIQVVGVLPRLPRYPGRDDVYVATTGCPFRSSPMMIHSREMRMNELFGLLKTGTSLEQARADVSTITRRLQNEYPGASPAVDAGGMPVVPLQEELTGRFRPTLLILLGTVGLVLLIACANVANLTLARLMNREREVVVRAALGASRGRLIRQLLTESTLMALLGGLLGLLIAFWTLELLVAFAQRFTPRAANIEIDGSVVLFALVLSVLTGLAFGTLPALQMTRHDLAVSLKEIGARARAGLGQRRFRSLLVVAQVAVSFILLVAAGLMIRTVLELQDVDPGFKAENVLTMKLSLPTSKYHGNAELVNVSSTVLRRLEEHPAIVTAGMSTDIPLASNALVPKLEIENRVVPPGQMEPQAAVYMASQDYFRTLGIPLLQGRIFNDRDHADAPRVVIINQTLARQHWPDEDPLGKRIRLAGMGEAWRTIVGVVGDVKDKGLNAQAGPATYLPMLQAPVFQIQLFVRTAENPLQVLPAIRGMIRSIDPEQPIADVKTLSQVRAEALAPSRLTAVLIGLFAILAFTITAIGISGVITSHITERTKEIGIRMALGARKQDVAGMVLRQSMGIVMVGLVVGIVVSLLLTKLLSSVLFGVRPTDPLTFGAVALVLLLVVGVSSLFPVRKATVIEPLLAIRS